MILFTSDCLEDFVGDLGGGLIFGKSIGIVQGIVCYRQKSWGRIEVRYVPTASSPFSAIVDEFFFLDQQSTLNRRRTPLPRSREIRNDVCFGGVYDICILVGLSATKYRADPGLFMYPIDQNRRHFY